MNHEYMPASNIMVIHAGIVMEYVEGRDLQKHLIENGGILSEDNARILFQQLLVAVRNLQELCIRCNTLESYILLGINWAYYINYIIAHTSYYEAIPFLSG